MPQMSMAEVLVAVLFGAMVAGGLVMITTSVRSRDRLRELAIRERIAMIEKGLVPSPESDPARFELLMGARRADNPKSLRFRAAGVMVMGLGAALIVLLCFAARTPEIGIGVGGGIFVLGLTSFLIGKVVSDE
jgi:hypothetical protein